MPIPVAERGLLSGGEQTDDAALVEDLALAAEHGGNDPVVASDFPDGGGGQYRARADVAGDGAVSGLFGQVFQGHGEGHHGFGLYGLSVAGGHGAAEHGDQGLAAAQRIRPWVGFAIGAGDRGRGRSDRRFQHGPAFLIHCQFVVVGVAAAGGLGQADSAGALVVFVFEGLGGGVAGDEFLAEQVDLPGSMFGPGGQELP